MPSAPSSHPGRGAHVGRARGRRRAAVPRGTGCGRPGGSAPPRGRCSALPRPGSCGGKGGEGRALLTRERGSRRTAPRVAPSHACHPEAAPALPAPCPSVTSRSAGLCSCRGPSATPKADVAPCRYTGACCGLGWLCRPSGSPSTAFQSSLSPLSPAGVRNNPRIALCHPARFLPPAWPLARPFPGKTAIPALVAPCPYSKAEAAPQSNSLVTSTSPPQVPHLPIRLQGHHGSLHHCPAPTSHSEAPC